MSTAYQNHNSPTNGEQCNLQELMVAKRWEDLIYILTKKSHRTIRHSNMRGWALLENGRYIQAAHDFRQIMQRIEKKGTNYDNQIYYRASYRYCLTLMKLGKYEQVIKTCDNIERTLKQIDYEKKKQFQAIKEDAHTKIAYRDQSEQDKNATLEEAKTLVDNSKIDSLVSQLTEIIFDKFLFQQRKRQYYLVSNQWFQNWIKWIDGEQGSIYPGPVDNSSLLRKISDIGYTFLRSPSPSYNYTSFVLKPQIREQTNFSFINQETFQFFKDRYGFQQEIKRHGIQDDDDQGSIFIDLHLRLIRCMMFPINPILQNIYSKFVLQISRKQSINQLKVRILQVLKTYQPKFQSFEIIIWKLDGNQSEQLLIKNVKRLVTSPQYMHRRATTDQKIKIQGNIIDHRLLIEQSQILPQDTLFIEVKEKNAKSNFQSNKVQTERAIIPNEILNGTHHHQQTKRRNFDHKPQQSYINYSYMKLDPDKYFNNYSGKNGLKNIGNTCFLASALQCLSSTQLLTKYFLTKQFSKSLNKSNKLGTGGSLAIAYYNLLIQLWTQRGSTAPWYVKKEVARKARQFAGYNQQDSSQFLNILIDTLHEDMNLIIKKPYIQYKDSDGRSDDVVSNEYWNNFLARNKSIMVELMYGQLKSKLRCLECDRISNTFDPFAILSLPIPINLNIQFSYLTIKRELVNINAVITDRTSFLELAQQFINHDKILQVQDTSHIMALAINAGKIVKIFEIGNTIYGQRQLLQNSQLIYYNVGLPYSQLVRERGFQIVEIRSYIYGYAKSQSITCPQILIIDPSRYSVRGLKELVFEENLIYMDDQLLGENSKQSELQNGNSLRGLNYKQMFNEETGEALHPYLYKLGIAQTIKKTPGFFSNKYKCQLTGQTKLDQQIGVQLNSLPPQYQLEQLLHDLSKKVTNFKRLILNSVWPQKSKIMKAHIESNKKIVHEYNFQPKKSQKSEITLQNCLSAFRSQQVLDGQDKWYCSRCKEHQRAKKKMDLFKLPKILIIQLKRFKQKGRSSYFWGPTCEKNSKFISFPNENLDLSEYILQGSQHHGNKKESLYDLYGVVHHMGSLYGGHYIATAQNFIDKKWYTYDDSHVSACRNIQEIVSSTAYVLFYKRKDIKFDDWVVEE